MTRAGIEIQVSGLFCDQVNVPQKFILIGFPNRYGLIAVLGFMIIELSSITLIRLVFTIKDRCTRENLLVGSFVSMAFMVKWMVNRSSNVLNIT